MTIEIEIAGRVYRATVVPARRGRDDRKSLQVSLRALDGDEEPVEHVVDVRETELGVSLIHASDGRVVDAAVTERAGGERLVQLPHVDLRVNPNGRRRPSAGWPGAPGTGEQRISAPMPGRVLRVFVRVDEVVTAGQALVVIEAMKMENALTALRDGRVREVTVSEGVSVEAGRLLLTIE